MPYQPTSNIRPGNRKKSAYKNLSKERQVDVESQDDISQLLAGKPHRKDLLLEYLHLIQDKWSSISRGHLHALADKLRLSLAEVYEVATFYQHFNVLKENVSADPPITVQVCTSLSCCMAGSEALLGELQEKATSSTLIKASSCMGLCDQAPAVAINKNYLGQATAASIFTKIENNETVANLPTYQNYQQYVKDNGYQVLKKIRQKTISTEMVINTLKDSGLKGLGGAGFPTATKLDLVRNEASPRYFCVNADEGEPGTFKDRKILSSTPHQFLEGLLIAAHCIDAQKVYIYLRGEYSAIYQVLQLEIQQLISNDLINPGYLEIRRGAGAYICGEESAMIESIEGKRGIPRLRPPYVAHQGLFGRPTLVQNVETLFWIPTILSKGAQWYSDQGKGSAQGLRSFSISGRVNKPGVIIAPAGSNVNELIELAGGISAGHVFKAYLPGGASGGILPANLGHLPLDFNSLSTYGCFVGSHAIIILSQADSIKSTVQNLITFFEDESCGQCTPCRVGCQKANTLVSNDNWDTPLITELCQTMADASICGLGQAAPNSILSSIKYFPEEL